jgi:endoglucanase
VGGPDHDHSPALWKSLAHTFRNTSDVILAPWGETVTDADCFLKGGVCGATFGPKNKPYHVAGMQQAVDVMRAAGFRGPIAIPGVAYANDLSQWLTHRPHDPLKQLVAEAHIYGGNTCSDVACFNRTLAPIARRVPLILGEFGETYDDSSCGSAKTAEIMDWADAHGVGYQAWTWNTWDTCGSLITDFDGTPRGEYGTFIRDRYVRTRSAAVPRS